MISLRHSFLCLILCAICCSPTHSSAAESRHETGWKPLFNGKNLDGWYIVIKSSKSDDPNHLVQIEKGAIHMYKDAPAGSQQPVGYIVTDREYSNYHLRLEY